ncbi:MAG: hypothetical protein IIU39_08200, partial [Ruminococcus sp.]|nr:hypothetical protein [Ruminococcus sp.]
MYKTTKKVVSIILCVLMLCCAFPTAAFAADANGTYYVAGNDAAVFGESWSPNYTKNKMTKNDDGKSTITYSNVAAGRYLFKVTDGTWDHSWGASNGDNYELTVYENNSDVTIIFDPDTQTISVTGYGCPYVIAGDLDLCTSAWDPTDNNNRMTEENGICTKTYNDVPSGDHSFKITQGNWDSASWGYNGDNFNFTLSDSCDVTITFNDQTKEINVSGDNISVINGVQYCTTKEEMQSEHPYNNSSSKTWKYTSPNATALSFTFSEE